MVKHRCCFSVWYTFTVSSVPETVDGRLTPITEQKPIAGTDLARKDQYYLVHAIVVCSHLYEEIDFSFINRDQTIDDCRSFPNLWMNILFAQYHKPCIVLKSKHTTSWINGLTMSCISCGLSPMYTSYSSTPNGVRGGSQERPRVTLYSCSPSISCTLKGGSSRILTVSTGITPGLPGAALIKQRSGDGSGRHQRWFSSCRRVNWRIWTKLWSTDNNCVWVRV